MVTHVNKRPLVLKRPSVQTLACMLLVTEADRHRFLACSGVISLFRSIYPLGLTHLALQMYSDLQQHSPQAALMHVIGCLNGVCYNAVAVYSHNALNNRRFCMFLLAPAELTGDRWPGGAGSPCSLGCLRNV